MSATPAAKPPRIKCPTCGDLAAYSTANPARPFCSERCRRIDLGAWASESFRVEVQPSQDAGEPDAPTPH